MYSGWNGMQLIKNHFKVLCILLFLIVLITPTVSAFWSSGWKPLATKMGGPCGCNYPTCYKSDYGLSWLQEGNCVTSAKYDFLCQNGACNIMKSIGAGRTIQVPSTGLYYMSLDAEWDSNGGEVIFAGVNSYGDNTYRRRAYDFSGRTKCVYKDKFNIGSDPAKVYVEASSTSGSVHVYNLKLTSCLPNDVYVYCDDGTAVERPTEVCNGVDDDCDGQIDEGLSFDRDGDGYTTPGSCEGTKNDCNDDDSLIYPGATERCNGLDDDCDTQVDEGSTCGNCPAGADKIIDRTSNPLHVAGIDCDGTVDDIDRIYNVNIPRSGWHEVVGVVERGQGGYCQPEEEFKLMNTYYNTDGTPAGVSVGQLVDDAESNCRAYFHGPENVGRYSDNRLYFRAGSNTLTMQSQAPACPPTGSSTTANSVELEKICIYYCPDADGDGYDASYCGGTDCDDSNPTQHPNAAEKCNGVDDNCNNQIDEGLTFDVDNDGYSTSDSCAGTKNDCDDNNGQINPGMSEICNNIDDNCNQEIDEGGVCGCMQYSDWVTATAFHIPCNVAQSDSYPPYTTCVRDSDGDNQYDMQCDKTNNIPLNVGVILQCNNLS